MAKTVCEAVKQGIVKRRGNPSIEWYKDGKPQYYCYGYLDAATDELLEVCRKCIDHADHAQEALEKWRNENSAEVDMDINEKVNTHIVIKKEDVLKYLEEPESVALDEMINKISLGRMRDKKKPVNHYYICNEDEPYADIVRGVILCGEGVKATIPQND